MFKWTNIFSLLFPVRPTNLSPPGGPEMSPATARRSKDLKDATHTLKAEALRRYRQRHKSSLDRHERSIEEERQKDRLPSPNSPPLVPTPEMPEDVFDERSDDTESKVERQKSQEQEKAEERDGNDVSRDNNEDKMSGSQEKQSVVVGVPTPSVLTDGNKSVSPDDGAKETVDSLDDDKEARHRQESKLSSPGGEAQDDELSRSSSRSNGSAEGQGRGGGKCTLPPLMFLAAWCWSGGDRCTQVYCTQWSVRNAKTGTKWYLCVTPINPMRPGDTYAAVNWLSIGSDNGLSLVWFQTPYFTISQHWSRHQALPEPVLTVIHDALYVVTQPRWVK